MKPLGLYRTICSSYSVGNAMGISKDDHRVVKGGLIYLFFNKYFLYFSHVPGTAGDAWNILNQETDKQESTM